jgi:PAS domain S-box-containing protein
MSEHDINNDSVTDSFNSNPHFLESMELVNRTIQGSTDLDEMMSEVLDSVLTIFDCDRAFLLYPCDPEAESWNVPMVRTRPEYPSVQEPKSILSMHEDIAASLQILLDNQGPVTFGEGNAQPFNITTLEQCSIKSYMAMAIYPKVDKPWQFGIHQCSRERTWSTDEIQLFQSIGQRLADGLSLLLTYKALKNREESYSRIVNMANEGIWSLDADGNTNYVNARMTEILGYSTDEMMGRPVTDFMFEEDIPDYLEKLNIGFRGAANPYERRYRRKDGEVVWALVSATGIYNRKGMFSGGFGMLTDITPRKQALETLHKLNLELETRVEERTEELRTSHTELEAAYEELKQAHTSLLQQEKMASIGQLASGIAHEINTPTQYVSNNIVFLHESLQDLLYGIEASFKTVEKINNGEAVKESLRNLEETLQEIDYDYLKDEIPRALNESKEGLKKIAHIVVAMKEFAQPSGSEPEPVDIEKVIENTIEVTRNSWKTVAEVTVDSASTPLIVNGLKDELGQALLNLVLNAVDAIDESRKQTGGRLGQIRIQTRGSSKWVEIEVTDTGCGIPPEVKKRIFEPFFTTKQVGHGSGQGLAIAYHIITDKHGGELVVDSAPEQGSCFTVRLPRTGTPQ